MSATAIEPKIAGAKAQMKKTQSLEASAPAAAETLDRIKALIPEGAPVAWFPPRIQDFFKRQGIEKSSVRLNNEFADKELPGFRKLFWSIELPKVEGMLLYPPGKFEQKNLPMFTLIHGGPADADGNHFEADWYQ